MIDWQPIETAPKDGTRICLWVTNHRWHFQIGYWWDSLTVIYGKPEYHEQRWSLRDGWVASGDPDWIPSHWAPLPQAPNE